MKRCYEFLRCKNTACKLHGVDIGPVCWEVEGTLCLAHERKFRQLSAEDKKEICRKCVYRHYLEVVQQFGNV